MKNGKSTGASKREESIRKELKQKELKGNELKHEDLKQEILKQNGESLIEKNRKKVTEIQKIFDRIYPDAACSLDYKDPLQLLIATQLAAQCTDARVNQVTPGLFRKYPDVYAFANANAEELEQDIKSTGFYRNKARNIINACQKIIKDYGGKVPSTMDELLTLPGVGRKTANLVLGDIFGIPGVVVDTHAKRLANRIGLTHEDDPYKIELDLQKVIPKENWGKFCHQLVYHGRAVCNARKPKCMECQIREYCNYYQKSSE